MNYKLVCVLKTDDEVFANKAYAVLNYYNRHIHLKESGPSAYVISAPEKDFDFCSDVIDAVKNSKFDAVDLKLNDIISSNVSIEKIMSYLESGDIEKKRKQSGFFSPNRLLSIYMMTFGLFIILTIVITVFMKM